MNCKRDAIGEIITGDLPKTVAKELRNHQRHPHCKLTTPRTETIPQPQLARCPGTRSNPSKATKPVRCWKQIYTILSTNRKNRQEAITAQAVAAIPNLIQATDALPAPTAERHKPDKGRAVSYLEHHLHQYTHHNTADFFIHKDIRGFFRVNWGGLKNGVLNLPEMEAGASNPVGNWFQLMRLIRRIGLRTFPGCLRLPDAVMTILCKYLEASYRTRQGKNHPLKLSEVGR